ncbi:MAG: type 1 glutamine amidotransferase domain-containing protein [Novosphingobium pentaromativorans]|uniref:Type 1 glutamine amidotransferase domain-containing protein n=1 Tax=Novosphingobium pentaromativorans TaxID=205844 RepID=A0A2W5NJ53_9SPHN|nr:type 1 glutamine amidotransferase domain-containing protein [Novosphingobium panipatense]PZQ53452.1 MAG: type 1 glutamine amidotransferase domain-containing protein [Novosphingobium pentaromativorans]
MKILIVLTSHAQIGETGRSTGVWIEELTTPYYAFIDAGADVDLASTAGGEVPVDPGSMAEADRPESVARFLADAPAMEKLKHSLKVADLTAEPYDAVFLTGGHGTMWDLPESTALADLLTTAFAEGKVVSAVCHGPAGLVNAKDTKGKPLVAGRKVSAFTNSEEEAAGLTHAVPFLMETRIRELGALYERGPDFQPHAVRDGNLVTGQNPASSKRVAQLVLEAIG